MNAPQPVQADLIRLLAQMGGRMGGALGGGMPPGMPPRTPPFLPSQGGSSTSAPPAYNVKNDPMASVGSLQPPRPPRPPTEFQGSGPVGTLISLLGNWHSSKKKDEQSEAARAAENLMQAIEGAKTSGDWTPAYTILHNNEKLFNKVYKGWLQQSEIQQKESSKKQKEPEPDVQGFEQGVQSYLSKKGGVGPSGSPGPQPQGSPPGAPPAGSAPRSMGGYLLPQAGPQQALAQQALSGERQATRQDPARTLSSQMTSGEQRQQQLAGAGLALTPKLQAELQALDAKVQEAQSGAMKASFELKKAEQQTLTTGMASDAKLKELGVRYQTALANLDKAKAQAENQRLKNKGLKTLTFANKQKLSAANQAETLLNSIITQKRSFSSDDIQQLDTMLRAAGATNLAKDLPQWWISRKWAGTDGVKNVLDSVRLYKGVLQEAAGDLAKPSAEEEPAAAGGSDEGDEIDADIIIDPNDPALTKKPD